MITENLSTLKIHKLTQEQYDREFEAGNIDPTALYVTPYDAEAGFTDIEEKIEYLQTYVTPQLFGAKGDGVTDDTNAINEAFASLENGGKIYFPPGTYIVNYGGPGYGSAIKAVKKNNITVELDNAAIIKHSLTSTSYYRILAFENCNGVEIFGGTIEGEADIHENREINSLGNLHQISSYCIWTADCNNVYIHDLVTANCYGDGIGIHVNSNSSVQCENIIVERCTARDHIRNGIVFSGVKNGIIRDCHIYNIAPNGEGTNTGCKPMAGIDLESHFTANNDNILVEGCNIHDCGINSVIVSARTFGTILRNNTLLKRVSLAVTSNDCLIENCKIQGTLFSRNNCTIKNCDIDAISVQEDEGASVGPNLFVQNSIIRGLTKYPTIQFSNVEVTAIFDSCVLNHLEDAEHPMIAPAGSDGKRVSIDLTLQNCEIHKWNDTKEGSNNYIIAYNSLAFDKLNIINNKVIVESNVLNPHLFKMGAKNSVAFVGNVIDLSKVNTYTQTSIVAFGDHNKTQEELEEGETLRICSYNCNNNTFVANVRETPLSNKVFSVYYTRGDVYITNNIAPTWDSIAGDESREDKTNNNVIFIKDNIISTTVSTNELSKVINNNAKTIEQIQNELTNYYTKQYTYSRDEIDTKISAIPKFNIQVVDTLPTENISGSTVYLVAENGASDNLYIEYIYVSNKWEKLGEQKVDLTGYVTESYVSEHYQPKGNYALKSELPEIPVTSVNGQTGEIQLDYEDVGAQPKGEYALVSQIPTIPVHSVNGKIGAVQLTSNDVGARPSTWTPTYTDVGAEKSGTADSAVSTHNTKTDAHNDIRLLIKDLSSRLDALANSDDETLDQMAEVAAYIKANRDLIEQVTTGKVSVTDIINNLITNVSDKPLSAAQGVELKRLIDAITVPTKLSELEEDSGHRVVTDTEKSTWNAKSNFSGKYADLDGKPTIPTIPTKVSAFENDKGYLTSYVESDPTVPNWAKAATKPSYTKSEVGLGNVDNTKQYSASNPPPYPVTSVNGKTNAVSLKASDVGAAPADKTITITGVDEDGATHTWTVYGVEQ